MTIQFRHYRDPEDYQRISDFLVAHYQPDNQDGNWVEPAWEYMHAHPALDRSILGKIGVWEDAGQIVAVAHYESCLGEAFFQVDPAYRFLRPEMLDYAEAHLAQNDGKPVLQAYVNDNDPEFLTLVKARGYQKNPDGTRQMCRLVIPAPFPTIQLPAGFQLKSLADECDWAKVNRVLWRGFDHAGEPPASAEDLDSRRTMFDTPKARRDLKIVVVAPNGEFAAFCGMFYEPTCRYAYVEPVATDPDFRRMGLGKAAVLEGIRRCAALGATVAYVGNDLPIYRSVGFTKVYNSECWVK